MPDVVIFNDYYPFGMLLPNRHGSTDSYRYGFNGMEKDDELKGEGNSYDYNARFYDSRINRFLSLDPKSGNFPYESNYVFVSNNPIIYKDPTGEAKIYTLTVTNRATGKSMSVSYVIDDDIESKAVSIAVGGAHFTEKWVSWHDINITQNIIIEEDGSITVGDMTETLLDHSKTLTPVDSETLAKAQISVKEAFGAIGPGEGETWNGGGIDFYSKNGDGSGTKAEDKSKLDYTNGDDLIALVKAAQSIGGKLSGNKEHPHPDWVKGQVDKTIKNLDLYKAALELYKKAKDVGKGQGLLVKGFKIWEKELDSQNKPKTTTVTEFRNGVRTTRTVPVNREKSGTSPESGKSNNVKPQKDKS